MNSAHELATLMAALRELRTQAVPKAALATLTRTRGSTFRRPGTRMLVTEKGQVVCELSGGCPQRDIVARALEVIASGEPRQVSYNAQSGLDALIEMGCGGELDVLIEPLLAKHDTDFTDTLSRFLDERRTLHMATLFALKGNVIMPRRLIWNENEVAYDAIDDASIVNVILSHASRSALPRANTLSFSSPHGVVEVLMETIAPPHALVVIGSSATARALLPLANALGWRATLVDHDPDRLRLNDLPVGLRTVCATPQQLMAAISLDAHSSVVVMTHNLEQDIAYLCALRNAAVAYIGVLGSRERVARMRTRHALEGLHVHAPAGLDIGSETPEEIALAIAAEIMAVIHHRHGGHLRDKKGSLHRCSLA